MITGGYGENPQVEVASRKEIKTHEQKEKREGLLCRRREESRR